MRLLSKDLNTIWKYDLPVEDDFVLVLPKGSIPLSVGVQGSLVPVMWVAVNGETEEKEQHKFYLRGTGHPFPELMLNRFVGTFQLQEVNLVFHLFDGGPLEG